MSSAQRVLDANINRAAEGMRVLEDIARFVLENKKLSSAIKECRHKVRLFKPNISSRDVIGDIGTTNTTNLEQNRKSYHDIAIASGNRCAEALRVVEEFLKLTKTKNTIESLRYEIYEYCAEVVRLLGAITKKQWSLCFVMTIDDCVLPWQDTLLQSLVAGCDCVQIREKNLDTKEFIEHVRRVKSITSPYNTPIIVNDRVDVMLATGANGVHLGTDDMTVKDARKLCGAEYMIGATVHSPNCVDLTMQEGADYLGVGSMFASATKPNVPIAPLALLKNALQYKHLAIGGVTPKNVGELYNIGCKGVAVSSAIAQSKNPEKIVFELLNRERQTT
tara:strand:+ start:446 stop:1447 length:1002 start_codon:yes stop_codon:yes gene_type:complete